MSPNPNDDYLQRVKAEIRAEADIARARTPLPRHEPPPRAAARAALDDGIERDRLVYATSELTGADYLAFIDQAFRALLKRPPDEAGVALQVRLLAAGASKAEVLGNLRWSPEGRCMGTRVRGLLPRYVMAKLTRMPLFGFAIEWALALAGLPLLLRHQRAADTSVAARFNATADAQREHGTRIQSLEQAVASAHAGLAALSAEHDRRSEALRADIRHAAMRLDNLEQRVETGAHAQLELRHYVHAANHWIASLQGSLAGLEDFAEQQRERADRLTAAIGESAQQTAARNARHATWSAELAQRLRADASVLDLGSGDGAWLIALRAQGIAANGIESNQALVARAQAHPGQLAAGDPLAALERCADASLGGLSVAASLLATAPVMAELLGQALRVLAADGWLLLRIEPESYRFREGRAARDIDPQAWIAVLEAAGFTTVVRLDADGAGALLAQRR